MSKTDLELQIRDLIKEYKKRLTFVDDDGIHVLMTGALPNGANVWI